MWRRKTKNVSEHRVNSFHEEYGSTAPALEEVETRSSNLSTLALAETSGAATIRTEASVDVSASEYEGEDSSPSNIKKQSSMLFTKKERDRDFFLSSTTIRVRPRLDSTSEQHSHSFVILKVDGQLFNVPTHAFEGSPTFKRKILDVAGSQSKTPPLMKAAELHGYTRDEFRCILKVLYPA